VVRVNLQFDLVPWKETEECCIKDVLTLLYKSSDFKFSKIEGRETREGWPLLTVETDETETIGDSWSTYDRGPSLCGSSCRYNGILSCLGCTSQPRTKYYFSHRTLFHFLSPLTPTNLGRQSCWLACLCVSGWGVRAMKQGQFHSWPPNQLISPLSEQSLIFLLFGYSCPLLTAVITNKVYILYV
jgi:hypothetical protein